MKGLADKNTKLAMAGGIYLFVAMIVAVGFTLRGSELLAQQQVTAAPAKEVTRILPTVSGTADNRESDDPSRGQQDSLLDPSGLVEPALDMVGRHMLRRVVL